MIVRLPKTYTNDNIVVCVLESGLTEGEEGSLAAGLPGEVIDGRVAFRIETEDEFAAAADRPRCRRRTQQKSTISGQSE